MPPQAATAGDGTRGTRPSPHLDGLYADALRHDAQSRCSPHGISTGGGAWTRKRWVEPRRRERGALPDMATKASESGGGQRARPAFRIGDMRSLRPCRGRKGTFGRAQQGFIDPSIEGCASLFRLYAQRGELNHQPPIPLGSLYSGKPPCSIPETPPFLEHEKREAVQMGKEAVLI